MHCGWRPNTPEYSCGTLIVAVTTLLFLASGEPVNGIGNVAFFWNRLAPYRGPISPNRKPSRILLGFMPCRQHVANRSIRRNTDHATETL
ncbi:hypothetical protein V1523DRAFT_77588 [Lipomyces doorenjongii]